MIDEFLPLSPVPEDACLEATQLPFTAFGQFGPGNMDIRVFRQDVYWVDLDGEPFYLDRLDNSQLMSVLRYLKDNADYFHACACREADITLLTDPDRIAGFIAENQHPQALPANDWLRATPLVRRLVALAWPS